jgi:hypothetical protein
MFTWRLTRPIAIGSTAIAIGAGAGAIVGASASTASGAAATASAAPGGGSNARSGPAAGGSSGTVDSVSKSSFKITTSAGQKVSVKKVSATKYRRGLTASSSRAVKRGVSVLVLGITNGTTITASKVVVQTTGGSTPPSAAEVVPFKRGAQSTAKQVGAIPTGYTEGSGTIVSGTTAYRATEAALASYPGGVVDRVVRLSSGEYEVHNIGVNWPHHIFVNQQLEVVGAD